MEGYLKVAVLFRLEVKMLVSVRRDNLLHCSIFQSNEFIPALAKYEPVYKEEEEAFTQWYVKTPMGKKRAKILEGDDDDKAKDKGKKK